MPSEAPTASDATSPSDDAGLVSLLGDTRAEVVATIRRAGEATIRELADALDLSEVAVRRHVAALSDDGLLAERTPPSPGRGRPATRYRLSERGRRLYPQRSGEVAGDLLEFLDDQHGREAVRSFLRWRLERQVSTLGDTVTAEDLPERLNQLAEALNEAGFVAAVEPHGDAFTLRQEHCAIYDVAKHHPEMCAYEAASFARALGGDVTLSRRQTLASGATACVCTVRPAGGRRAADDEPKTETPPPPTPRTERGAPPTPHTTPDPAGGSL